MKTKRILTFEVKILSKKEIDIHELNEFIRDVQSYLRIKKSDKSLSINNSQFEIGNSTLIKCL